MKTYERNCTWWLKQKKQMALVFITITLTLQIQIKGCVGCVETERIGLLQLKSYLNSLLRIPEEESMLKSWIHDDPKSDCCLWERVKCSDAIIGGHIINLTLDGLIPDKYLYSDEPRPLNLSLLHSFPQLKTLDFSWNRFSYWFDPIHGMFLHLSKETTPLYISVYLHFSEYLFTVSCHKSFQRLENLETLDMSYNLLNNSVLPFLDAARSLRTLNLENNTLEGVFLPNGVVFPSSLQVLNLKSNQLSFNPEGYSEICRLTYLRELDLSHNALKSLPYCLGNLTRLRTLDLSDNQLNGNLSSFVSGLPQMLEYLSLLRTNCNGSFWFNSLVSQRRLTVFKLSSKVGMIQALTKSSWVPLFQLKILKLQNFILGRTIPSFLVHQHDLRFVDISYSQLTGAFPTWLVQNNTRLHTIILNNNSLTELQLPRFVHGLQVLDISSNMIYDSIQEDIGIVFPHLRYMNFSSNHFHGTIPSSMGEMKSLLMLDMSFNGLSGQLPKTVLSSCYSLKFLKLSNNNLEGEIFPEHANLTGLAWLALDGNNFNGSLGKGLLNSKNLTLLDISDNSFSGTFPLWVGTMSNLSYLYMRGNQLKGLFPSQLQQNLQLKVIDISQNSFSGSIPRNVHFPFLRELRLHSNEFMGTIPDTLIEAELLEVLDMRNNKFSGMILNAIGKTSILGVLLLRNNSFETHIPEKICQLRQVGILDLSQNQFKGPIPACFSKMSFGAEKYDPNMAFDPVDGFSQVPFLQNWSYTSALNLDDDFAYGSQFTPATIVDFLTKRRYEAYQGDILRYMYGLDLSSNQLSGEIPVEIGDLVNMVSLNLSSNLLTGSIPNSISKLKDLGSLDLSNNKLDGNIPPELSGLNNLGFFNVSYNNLSGEIPIKGHLLTFQEKSYIGNDHLCGFPTNKSCIPTRVPEPSASKQAKEEEEESDDVIDMVWFYWTCGTVYISTSLVLFAFVCIDSRWSRAWFYRIDLLVHHLQCFKGRFVSN